MQVGIDAAGLHAEEPDLFEEMADYADKQVGGACVLVLVLPCITSAL